MRLGRLLVLFLTLCLAVPAQAERLEFDHRLYPPLKQVLDSGESDRVLFDASNPRYVIDRIAVRGTSPVSDWTELLEIVARTPTRDVRSADDWAKALQRTADAACPNSSAELARDAISVTFERRSTPCPAEPAPFALYRIVAGKRSLFLLAVLSKTELGAEQRQQWLALLASAQLK